MGIKSLEWLKNPAEWRSMMWSILANYVPQGVLFILSTVSAWYLKQHDFDWVAASLIAFIAFAAALYLLDKCKQIWQDNFSKQPMHDSSEKTTERPIPPGTPIRVIPSPQDLMDMNVHMIVGIVNGTPLLGYSQAFWEQLNTLGIARKRDIPYMMLDSRTPHVIAMEKDMKALEMANDPFLTPEEKAMIYDARKKEIEYSIPQGLQTLLGKPYRTKFEDAIADIRSKTNDDAVVLSVAYATLYAIRMSIINKIIEGANENVSESMKTLYDNTSKLNEHRAKLELVKKNWEQHKAICPKCRNLDEPSVMPTAWQSACHTEQTPMAATEQ
jgi:hypothetical protein